MNRFFRVGAYCAPLSHDEIEDLWGDALRVLAECGVDLQDQGARDTLRNRGARVDDARVRLDPVLVQELLALAPEGTVLCARNPANDVHLGANETVSTPLYGATHVELPDGVKRPGTLADLEAFHKAAQAAPVLQNLGSNILEPTDIDLPLRHLATMRSVLVNGDKTFMPVTTSRDAAVSALGLAGVRAQDSVAMARIALGPGFDRGPCMIGVATCNAALTWPGPALDAMRIFAEAGQAVILAPFAVVGKNAAPEPSTLLTQVLVEVLAGAVYCQAVRPGTPVLFGPHFAMRPDCAEVPQVATDLLLAACGQLARRCGLPFRASGGLTNATTLDARAAAEALGTITASLSAGAHFLFHAAGWLDNGLTVSMAKFAFDCDLLAQAQVRQEGLTLARAGVARSMLCGWGPGREHAQDAATLDSVRKHYGLDAGARMPAATPLSDSVIADLDAYIAERTASLLSQLP